MSDSTPPEPEPTAEDHSSDLLPGLVQAARERERERLFAVSRDVDAGAEVTVTGGALQEPIVVTASNLDHASQIATIEALKALCEGWEPSAAFYTYWQRVPAPLPEPYPEEVLQGFDPDVRAELEKEHEQRVLTHEASPWLHQFTIHTKHYHFWTGHEYDSDVALAQGIQVMAAWLNNPLPHSIDEDLQALADDGMRMRNLWGPAMF